MTAFINRIILMFIFTVILFFKYFSQNCSSSLYLKEQIERNFGNKTFDSIPFLIKQLPKDGGVCYQEYLIFKIRLELENKKLDSAEVLISELNVSLTNNYNSITKNYEVLLRGRYHYNKESNDSASYYYLKSLELSKLRKDSALQIKSLTGLSSVFANLAQYNKAIYYAKESKKLAKKLKDNSSEILSIGNLMGFYGKMYLKEGKVGYLDSAKAMSEEMIYKARNSNNAYALLKGYSGLGSCYLQYEDYNTVLAYSDSIIKYPGSHKYPKIIGQAYGNLCDAYLSTKQFALAKTAADSSLSYALKFSGGSPNAISDIYYKMYDCENELKNYYSALGYYKKYSEIRDSIRNEEQFSLVNELEQKYNKFENEKTINDLKKEKEISSLQIKILLISIFAFIILVVLVTFFFRQKNLKQAHTLLETEQRLNRSRINPHFFFNSITTLQGIALKENDGKKIYTNLYNFSNLMRETLESSYSDLVPISKEISFLNKYIELQKLNQKDKFSFEVYISPEIEQDEVLIPSMIIQPFIENSIEHGFSEIELGGVIKLEFDVIDHELLVTIADNGKGAKIPNEKKQNHTSRAMQITTDRLNLINNLYGTNSRFLCNFESAFGTKVEVFLPLDLKYESSGNR